MANPEIVPHSSERYANMFHSSLSLGILSFAAKNALIFRQEFKSLKGGNVSTLFLNLTFSPKDRKQVLNLPELKSAFLTEIHLLLINYHGVVSKSEAELEDINCKIKLVIDFSADAKPTQ